MSAQLLSCSSCHSSPATLHLYALFHGRQTEGKRLMLSLDLMLQSLVSYTIIESFMLIDRSKPGL